MTNSYLTNITPDSFSGIIFALEGIKNTVVLMNGPTGCKFYHSATSDNQMLRQREFDPLNYPVTWYFGQPRVPCTYLDTRDYVYGSKDKLYEAVTFLKDNVPFDLLAIVNSPGAALIGDDLYGIVRELLPEKPIVTVATPKYSQTIWQGYRLGCSSLIEQLGSLIKEPIPTGSHTLFPKHRPTINIIGMSIYHKYYQGDFLELKRLLELCGIDITCTLCCDCTLDEITHLGDADYNLVINAAYGLETARLLEERFSTPYMVSKGIPVGFSAMEELLRSLCQKLKADCSRFDEEGERARARAYIYLSRLNSLTGLPKGVPFAVHGTSSECYGYCRFLIQYLGMAADSVSVLDSDQGEDDYRLLEELLDEKKMSGALHRDIMKTKGELVFADANILARLKAMGHSFSGIENSLPTMGYMDVIPKTHLGFQGGLFLVEQVINGLMY